MPNHELNTPYAGLFWRSDDPKRSAPGSITLTSTWQYVELSEIVTETERVTERHKNYVTLVPNEIGNEEITIHGILRDNKGRATLLRSNVRHYSRDLMYPGLEAQRFESSYALIGGHVDGPDSTYSEFRFRSTGLDEWARLEGLTQRIAEDRSSFSVHFQKSENESQDLPNNAGSIRFEIDATMSQLKVSGSSIHAETWLRVTTRDGYTLEQIVNEFAAPLTDLLTLLFAIECPRDKLEVRDPDSGRWLKVFSYGQKQGRVMESRMIPFFYLNSFGLAELASWFGVVSRFTPLVQLLAGVVSDPTRTIQNQVLELATACEGLHRRRSSSSRNLSPEQVKESQQILKESTLCEKAKEILSNALRIYLWDLSFPQRIEQLALDVEPALPGVSGRTNRWKRAVADARNGFAHSLVSRGDSTENILGYAILAQSLRWLMLGTFLIETGIEPERISDQASQNESYKRFLGNASDHLPEIFGTTD